MIISVGMPLFQFCARWVVSQDLQKSLYLGDTNDIQRGAVVEWLEWLSYGAESRRKVVSSRLGFAMRRPEPSSEWVSFLNQGRIRQPKRDGLRLSSAVLKIQWDSNPHCPYDC